jgi:hypothetical protein
MAGKNDHVISKGPCCSVNICWEICCIDKLERILMMAYDLQD